MAVRLRRPTGGDLRALLERCAHDELTYAPAGASLGGPTPAGLSRRRWATTLTASSAFGRAGDAIRRWSMHRGAGLIVVADGDIAAGTNVAMAAPLPVGWVEVTCRIVAVVDERDRYGFAYGTLSIHPEQGEESFVVTRGGDDRADLAIEAVSRPVHPLSKLAPPVAHRLQANAIERYLAAMRAAVESGA